MSQSPIRPKLTHGALAVMGESAHTISFQYNPEQLRRTIQPQTVGGQGDRSYGVRFTGAAGETIEMQLRLDATDGLEVSDGVTEAVGIANRLAQLELLASPDAASVQQRESLLQTGVIEILPAFAPLVMLVLGPNRTMPVKLLQLSVTEEAFDAKLNPIRATVDVTMQVLTSSDVLPSNPAYRQYIAYQQSLTRLAAKKSGAGS